MLLIGTPISWHIVGELYLQEQCFSLINVFTTSLTKMACLSQRAVDHTCSFDRVPFRIELTYL